LDKKESESTFVMILLVTCWNTHRCDEVL